MTATVSLEDATVTRNAFSIGLDVGGTKTFGILLDAEGNHHGTVRFATRVGPDGVVDSVTEAVAALCKAATIDASALTGIGIGIPGVVDRNRGEVSNAVNLGINSQPLALAKEVSSRLSGLAVSIDNDLNVAALGAATVLYPDLPSTGFLALGTGVAAGLVQSGQLLRGTSGAAGEIGHLPWDPSGPPCPCGQRGCLELYASGSSLNRQWQVTDEPAPAALFAAAAAGDAAAQDIRDRFLRAVAYAVQLMVLSWDPSVIVIGGGVSLLGEQLLTPLRGLLEQQANDSGFLQSLAIAQRVALVPPDIHVAALGAAIAGRGEII